MTPYEPFEGFSPAAVDFLAELGANNDRAWFQPRKADYERLLKRPLEALCVALAQRFEARDLPLRADPATSPFRLYRDVRFSRDKSPYKTNVAASFPWTASGDRSAGDRSAGDRSAGDRSGGAYFSLGPGEIFVGGGMWHPEPARLAAWRELVAGDPRTVHAAVDDPAFVAAFGSLDGERLTRVPRGYARDHPDAELLRLKDVTFGRRLSDAEAFSPALPDTIADALVAALPVLRLLGGLTPSDA